MKREWISNSEKGASGTVKIDGRGAKMIAHRGVSGIETENTIAAFVAAGNRSYYGIETDVRRTADGVFVCCHDDTTEGVSAQGEKDVVISRATYDEVKRVRLADRTHGGGERDDLRVPLLADYISVLKTYGKHAFLELKGELSEADIGGIVSQVRSMNYLDSVTFICFTQEYLRIVKRFSSDQPCQLLTGRLAENFDLEELGRCGIGLDVCYPDIRREYYDFADKYGLPVNCWTVDSPSDAAKLIDDGVGYITTNILE